MLHNASPRPFAMAVFVLAESPKQTIAAITASY
jgi:hypothetical protein